MISHVRWAMWETNSSSAHQIEIHTDNLGDNEMLMSPKEKGESVDIIWTDIDDAVYNDSLERKVKYLIWCLSNVNDEKYDRSALTAKLFQFYQKFGINIIVPDSYKPFGSKFGYEYPVHSGNCDTGPLFIKLFKDDGLYLRAFLFDDKSGYSCCESGTSYEEEHFMVRNPDRFAEEEWIRDPSEGHWILKTDTVDLKHFWPYDIGE